jgi:hypothetical protein
MSELYDRWRLPDLLQMIEADTDEATAAHLKAWRDKCDLLASQKRRLTQLVDELTQQWDPARSEAAQILVNTMTNLIAIIDEGTTRAATTHTALQAIGGTIAETRTALRDLAAQYYDKAEAIRKLNRLAAPLMPDRLIPDTPLVPMPGFDTLAMRRHQADLDDRARAIMRAADGQVREAAGTFAPIPTLDRYDTGAHYDSKSSGSDAGRTGPGPLVFNPPRPSVAIDSTAPPVDTDAVLAGVAAPAPPPLGPPAITVPASAPMRDPLTPVVVTSPRPKGWLTDVGGGQRVMRPGGVIGDRGAIANVAQPGRHRAVPSVIGREPVGAPVAGRPGESRGRFAGSGRNRRGRRDPDDPWAVEQGVPPVLEAPAPPDAHDPGAGVIGIDR